jgi:fibronectin type 3 domain-containing protein
MSTDRTRTVLLVCCLLCVALVCCRKDHHHSVTLTWQSPPATGAVQVAFYNLYRSANFGQQFEKIASRVSGPPYEDHEVLDGRTYFYVVTAVDKRGRESRYSSEARVAIP